MSRSSRFFSFVAIFALFAAASADAFAQTAPPPRRGPGSPPVRTGSRSAGRADIRPIPSDRYYRGVKLIEEGDFTKAALFYQEELRDAVRIGTDQWLDSLCYYAMLGEACYQAGELDDALRELTWIVESQPAPFNARLTRSSILIEKGRFGEAIVDCDWLIANGDEAACAGAFNNRGVAKLAVGRDEEAAVDFETA